MGADPITAGLNVITKGLDVLFPDPKEKAEAMVKVHSAIASGEIDLAALGRDVVVAEAKGESWLQRNWRPLVMLWFAGLVGAHWLGFTAPNITEQVVLSLLGLVKLGLGGYVVGRSTEKVAKTLAGSGGIKGFFK